MQPFPRGYIEKAETTFSILIRIELYATLKLLVIVIV